MTAAIKREALAVRNSLGCVDMSTLGKIDIYGADAMLFLSRLYCNNFATLKIGQLRYVLMLREDGYVLDDGTISRLGENHFHLTITTANAGKGLAIFKKATMVDWPELDVTLTSVSDQWASLAITGPYARDLLSALKPDFDVLPAGLPFASVRIGHLYGYPVRVFGVSFSGELFYEINTPSGYADALLSMVMEHGKAWNITPMGWKHWMFSVLKKAIYLSGQKLMVAGRPMIWAWVKCFRAKRILLAALYHSVLP